jgi:chemotaxis protein CheD
MRDTQTGFGGMNHFLLPEGKAEGLDEGRRYGAFAMELLINEILRSGGRRERMEAKLFGGARMFGGLSDVGASNAAFAEKFLRDEGIPVVGGSLGGFGARRVQFWPYTGRAQQRTVTDTNEVARLREIPAKAPPAVVEDEGDLELF